MTISPQDLNAEERALWDTLAIRKLATGTLAANAYARSEGALTDLLTARRALFTPESEQPAQVGKCPHCRAEVGMDHRTIVGAMEHFSCEEEGWKPAPVAAVRMTEELAHVLRCACELSDVIHKEHDWAEAERINKSVAAVRAQAAAQPGKLVKVREFLQRALAMTLPDGMRPVGAAALAELDAAEGR